MAKLSLRHSKVGSAYRITLVMDGTVDVVTMTEETWDELENQHAKFIRPINEKRAADREKAKRKALEADRVRRQKVVDLHGTKWRLQTSDGSCVVEVWLDGFARDEAPFELDLDIFSTHRPWVIKGRCYEKTWDGRARRLTVVDRGNHDRRFASWEAAALKALELQAAGEFMSPQEREAAERGTA